MRAVVRVAMALALVIGVASPAIATFEGRNGDIVVCARLSHGGPRGLLRMDADGSGLARLVPAADWEDIAPAWSPDGTQVAFTSTRTGNRDIWILDVETGDEVNITHTPNRFEWLPTWSPDGRIAFMVEYDDAGDTIDVIDVDGSDRRTLVEPPGDVHGVEWSPSGGRIVYGVDFPTKAAIHSIRPDGTGFERWARGLPHVVVFDFKSDARWVLFLGQEDGRYKLFEIATAGEHRIRRVTDPGVDDRDQHAVYSPNGRKVLFVRTTPEGDGLWTVALGGSNERLLRPLTRWRVFGVTWQPR